MKNKILTTLSIIAFMGGFLIIFLSGPVKQVAPIDNQVNQQPNNSQQWETKTDEHASVTVVVTPIDLSSQSTKWKFNVAMDTHSIELNEDMMESAVLMDEQGREYKPVNWDGPTGGHHLEGVLTFKRVMPSPQSIELKITGVGD